MADHWSRVHVRPAALKVNDRSRNDDLITLAPLEMGDQPQYERSAPAPSLSVALNTRRKSRSMSNLDRDQPFSWLRCLVSIASYGLVLSDVLRTGPGIRDVSNDILRVEPDSVIFLGPVGYAANHLTQANATAQASGRLWPYKYDTTSIGMRAFAQHFRLPSWSPCLLYRERCDESNGWPLHSIFAMIDSMVAVLEDSNLPTRREMSRPTVSLRVTSVFKDRLHHYVLPSFYGHSIKRTVQATHYDWTSNHSSKTVVCNSLSAVSPYSCAETWTRHLRVSCALAGRQCRDARTVWLEIPKRIQFLANVYPHATIDSVIIDGTDDYTRGGLTYQGRRRADVVMFSRIRSCTNNTCTTEAVDDYRFESMGAGMNVGDWFYAVGLLRALGQAYTWLRVLLLIWICHTSSAKASRRYRRFSWLAKCASVVRTIFLVPSQVVIYGSLVPISLYFVAHMIDSPATYALVSVRFNSLFGQFTWTFSDFINHCAVSMRAVWVLSFQCHLLQAAFTRCLWSPAQGIPGVSEFFITAVASLTIFAEYRALTLRNTEVLDIHVIATSARMHKLRSYSHNGSPTALNNLLLGSTVDWKCIVSATACLILVCAALWALNRGFSQRFPFQVSIVSRTLVPYSADFLWPRNRLVVSWFGSLVTKDTTESRTKDSFRRKAQIAKLHSIAMPAMLHGKSQRSGALRETPDRGLVLRDTETSLQAQREMQSTTSRSREIESAIYLMNLAVMTDPITILQLRFFSGRRVALYESTLTQQCFMLPYDVRTSNSDIAIDWAELQLVAVANTKDLEWDDLLRCG